MINTLRHVLIVRITVLLQSSLGKPLSLCVDVLGHALVDSVAELPDPGEFKLKHLVLDLVVHHVDDPGGLLNTK